MLPSEVEDPRVSINFWNLNRRIMVDYNNYHHYFTIIIIIIIRLCRPILLISSSTDLWKITFISSWCSCVVSILRLSVSSFSSHYLKTSRRCILLLPTLFTSVIFSSMTSWRRQLFHRIRPTNWHFYAGY